MVFSMVYQDNSLTGPYSFNSLIHITSINNRQTQPFEQNTVTDAVRQSFLKSEDDFVCQFSGNNQDEVEVFEYDGSIHSFK